jgi:hypothetical protein
MMCYHITRRTLTPPVCNECSLPFDKSQSYPRAKWPVSEHKCRPIPIRHAGKKRSDVDRRWEPMSGRRRGADGKEKERAKAEGKEWKGKHGGHGDGLRTPGLAMALSLPAHLAHAVPGSVATSSCSLGGAPPWLHNASIFVQRFRCLSVPGMDSSRILVSGSKFAFSRSLCISPELQIEIWMELDQNLESELEDFELGIFALREGFKTSLYRLHLKNDKCVRGQIIAI